jgi:hypothetical protein
MQVCKSLRLPTLKLAQTNAGADPALQELAFECMTSMSGMCSTDFLQQKF